MSFQQIKPQKARGRLQESYWLDSEWIAEEKYDGDRRIAQFINGIVRFTGCRESVDGSGFVEKTDNLPQLNGKPQPKGRFAGPALMQRVRRLDGTVLDGEMVVPIGRPTQGGRSKYVTSIMGSLPAEAERKQIAEGFLSYVVFDCLWYKGLDIRGLPLEARVERRNEAVRLWGNDYARIAGRAVGKDKRSFYESIVKNGGEGVVLKHVDHRYGDEKLWVKVKAQATADVVVMGFTEGKGKYEGQIGAVVFGQSPRPVRELRECGQCSGITDDLRQHMTERPDKFMGRVMEITHNGREPTGRFRHPRFSRWRDDKQVSECVYNPEET